MSPVNPVTQQTRDGSAVGRAGASVTRPASPPAQRLARPSWRDPRLALGAAIVAVSVLLGAQLLAGADDTVPVWSADRDLAAGTEVTSDLLRRAEVRFDSAELAGRYLPADAPVPSGLVVARDVAAGELVPRTALGEAEVDEVAELPISVAADAVPTGLGPGALVDVWVTPTPATEDAGRAVRVLESVPVVAAPRNDSALGPSSTRQVVVGVPGEDEETLARALARLAAGTAVLVRRG